MSDENRRQQKNSCTRYAVLISVLSVSVLAVAGEPETKPVERHYLTTFRGQPYSVIHETEELRAEGGVTVRVVTSIERIRLRASGGLVEQTVRRRRIEMPDGTLLSFEETIADHRQRQEMKVERRGREYVITTGLRLVGSGGAGAERGKPAGHTVRFTAPGKVIFDLDGRALKRAGKLTVGETTTAYVLAITEKGIAQVEATVLGRRRVEVEGKTHEAYLVEVRNKGGGKDAPSWQLFVGPDGELLTMDLSPGMVRFAVPAAKAVLPARPARISGALKTSAHVRNVERVDRMEVEFEVPSGRLPPESPRYQGRAKATAAGRSRTRMTLQASWPDGRLKDETLSDADRKQYLAPSLRVQSKDPAIAALARNLTGGIDSEMKRAYMLARWVNRTLRKEAVGPAAGSAIEAFRDRSGDCTEHTALLCALARASRIPARPVSGLVHEDGAFRFHQWAELYLSGRWVPVDAALGRFGLPAVYFSLTGGDEAAGRLWALTLQAAGAVRVLNIHHEGSGAR